MAKARASIDNIKDGIERDLLNYHQKYSERDFYGAMWALNAHFSKNGMAVIDEEWGSNGCDFMSLSASKSDQKRSIGES